MHRRSTSTIQPGKVISLFGVVLAFSLLIAAHAHGARVIVPQSAQQVTVPQTVPQPVAPGSPSAPNLPAPMPPTAPQHLYPTDDGFSPREAIYPPPRHPTNDVGHNAGELQEIPDGPVSREGRLAAIAEALQSAVEAMQGNLLLGLAENPFAAAYALASSQGMLENVQAGLREAALRATPEVARREIMGYSGVSDQACGDNYATINREEIGAGISFC